MSIINEVKSIISTRWNRILIFWLPLIIAVYFSLLFSNGIVENIPTVIVDNDNSSFSRALIQEFENSQHFNILTSVDSWHQGYNMVLDEKAHIIVAIPANFGANIMKKIPSEVAVSVNASNLAISSTALKNASEIILSYSTFAQMKALQGQGFAPALAENIALPLKISYIELNNERGNFADFLIWGLIGAIVHFPVMLLSSVSLFENKSTSVLKTILGKIGAISLLGLITMMISIFTANIIYPLSLKGNILQLTLLTFVFLSAIAAFGLFISSFSPNKFVATQLGIIVVLPALILSGYTWPLTEFPWFIKILGLAEPLSYYVIPLRKISLSGFAQSYWLSILIMTLMGTLYTLLAIILYKRRVKKWRKTALES